MPSTTITTSTGRDKEVLDITDRVQKCLSQLGVAEGLCNVFVTHTTAGLTSGESTEGTDQDLME